MFSSPGLSELLSGCSTPRIAPTSRPWQTWLKYSWRNVGRLAMRRRMCTGYRTRRRPGTLVRCNDSRTTATSESSFHKIERRLLSICVAPPRKAWRALSTIMRSVWPAPPANRRQKRGIQSLGIASPQGRATSRRWSNLGAGIETAKECRRTLQKQSGYFRKAPARTIPRHWPILAGCTLREAGLKGIRRKPPISTSEQANSAVAGLRTRSVDCMPAASSALPTGMPCAPPINAPPNWATLREWEIWAASILMERESGKTMRRRSCGTNARRGKATCGRKIGSAGCCETATASKKISKKR